MFHAQELGSYAQGRGSLAVFKVTARDQGHYKGHLGAFVTYCNISCFVTFFAFLTFIKYYNLDFFRALILQKYIGSMHLVPATHHTVVGRSF